MPCLEYLLRNGIEDAVDADTDLDGAITEFYYIYVPGTAVKPYLVLSFGRTSKYEALKSDTPVATDVPIFLDIYSDSVVSVEAETIQAYLHALFGKDGDAERITVTGYKPMKMRPMADLTLYEDESTLWHIHCEYKGVMIPS